MRFTDMLRPKTEVINRDGKRYEFTPGENANLVVRGKGPQMEPLISTTPRTKSKIILPKKAPTSVGAARG